MPDRARWLPKSAWNDLDAFPPTDGAALNVDVIEADTIATLVARHGQESNLSGRVREHLGIDLPEPCRVHLGSTCDLVWSGPAQWLAITTHDAALANLSGALDGVATIVDQSDSRGLVRIAGPKAREVLMKGFAIDLHPSAFATGSAATTKVAHLSVQIWQVDDAPTYKIAIPRSFAGTFRSWLVGAYAPYAKGAATV